MCPERGNRTVEKRGRNGKTSRRHEPGRVTWGRTRGVGRRDVETGDTRVTTVGTTNKRVPQEEPSQPGKTSDSIESRTFLRPVCRPQVTHKNLTTLRN